MIEKERIAYVAPADTKWCVSIRDGTGLSENLFTVSQRSYYDTAEEARDAAKRRVESGSVNRLKLSAVAQRFLEE